MGRLFDITTTNDTLALDAGGRGQIVFTVTNATSRPVRGRLKAKALDSGESSWLSIAGEVERDFAPNGTQQVTLNVAVPAGAPPGRFRLRLDGVSVANPDEDFTEGPTISVDVKHSPAPPPSRWWIWVVAAVVLIVGAVVVYLASSSGSVVVPSVVGSQYKEARLVLTRHGLSVRQEEQASPTVRPETVLGQVPAAGKRVKPGTEVTLTVAAVPRGPATVEVPSVVGRAFSAANSALAALGFRVAHEPQAMGDDCPGKVVRQTPPAGFMAQAASTVTLYVGILPYGPDQCRSGYVWRDAFPGDHVCVTVQRRAETAQENQLAESRRSPTGGAYGPDTCRQGYVWREARPSDHVCVHPDRRTLAREDNAQTSSRRACAN